MPEASIKAHLTSGDGAGAIPAIGTSEQLTPK